MKKYRLKEWIINQTNEPNARKQLAKFLEISKQRLSELANAQWGDNVNMKAEQEMKAMRLTGYESILNPMPEELYGELAHAA